MAEIFIDAGATTARSTGGAHWRADSFATGGSTSDRGTVAGTSASGV